MQSSALRAISRTLQLPHAAFKSTLLRPALLVAPHRTFAALPDHTRMTMPRVSPTMTHGRLVEWKVAEGDAIAEGDTVAEVETDKATMPIEAKDEGFMAKILVAADTPDIPLGELIAITVEEEQHLAAFKDFVDDAGGGLAEAPKAEAPKTEAAPSQATAAPKVNWPEHRELGMPKVSPTMTVGRLVEWKVAEGDAIAEGDVIAEVETDKATMPIEAKDEGFMAKILVPADTADIPLGQVLAITVEEADLVAAFKDFSAPVAGESQPEPTPEPASPTSSTSSATSTPTAPQKSFPAATSGASSDIVSPAVARLLGDFPAIDLSLVSGTGPKGIVLKGDVMAAIVDGTAFGNEASSGSASAGASQGAPSVGYTDTSVTSMRRAIARRLTESKSTIPHRYATESYELDAVLALRKRINAADPSPKVSVNDFAIHAVAAALRRVPEMNAQFDAATGTITRNESIDISFAVAIEGGLITPIVKRADSLGLLGIAAETKRLVALAREGKLKPDEFEGGSFSTSNLGMFGVSSFSAIINPPQSGNLAIGAGVKRCLPGGGEDGSEVRIATVGTSTLSSDARIVGEDVAAKFLDEFAKCMDDPSSSIM